ncbi:MAG: LysR family transcriptional regulator [Clostridia bacterium]|nr:LysR family transcriptional regulator [Clostridia bacterium]
MNINQLKYFHAVATYHTVSAAAKQLYISQPSLSAAIKELEREFALTLFYRRHNGMFLTPEGTKLYNASKELLIRYGEVEGMMHDLGKDVKQLRLGIPPMISSFILADIYKGFSPENPDVDLTITERGRYELLDMLNDGLLDVILLPHIKEPDSSFSAKRIGSLELLFYTACDSPKAELYSVSPRELEGEPLVLFPDSFFQTRTVKRWFHRMDVEPRVALQTEQLSTAESLIASGAASGFLLKGAMHYGKEVREIPLDPPVRIDVSVLYKKDSFIPDSMLRLERFLEAISPFDK